MARSFRLSTGESARGRSEGRARQQLCDLLQTFYAKGWISGTGGGICSLISEGELLLAPSGVHKERVRPEDFFVVNPRDGRVIRRPGDRALKPSECSAIFRAVIADRGAGSVIHSHALSAVLAADLADANGYLEISGFEMLKGIRGCSSREIHRLPVVENTSEEPELTGSVTQVLGKSDFAGSHSILVRDHGAYIWGADVWEAKRHAEVYHFLFEAVIARKSRVDVKR